MILLIDNYDSFSHNLLNYCRQIQPDCMLIRNDEKTINEIEELNPVGFIFSPGPGRPEDHPLMFEILEKWGKAKPVLGICLGFQAINEFFGAYTEKASYPIHGKTSTIEHNGHKTFEGIPYQFEVTRYHSLISSNVNNIDDMEITAYTVSENTPMATAHKKLPIWGLQFHPEAILTDYGLLTLENWFKSFTFLKVLQ